MIKNYRILIFVICLLCFLPFLSLYKIIGWDTHNVNTINFLFCFDYFKQFRTIPTWNPLILSGTPILPSLFFSSAWSPIGILLIYLSSLINHLFLTQFYAFIPVYVFTWYQFRIIQHFTKNSKVAFFWSIFLSLLISPFYIGQISFLYSLSFFSLILFLFLEYFEKESNPKLTHKSFLYVALALSLFSSGYGYLNIISLIFLFIFYLLSLKKKAKVRPSDIYLLLYLAIPTLGYLFLNAEAIINLKLTYKGFDPNFSNQDPGMRHSNLKARFLAGNPLQTIRILLGFKKGTWTSGFTPILGLLFPIFFYFFKKNIIHKAKTYILILFLSGFILSTSLFGIEKIIKYIPLIGWNRWAFINLNFSVISGIYICALFTPTILMWSSKSKRNNRIFKVLFVLIIFSNLFFVYKDSHDNFSLSVKPEFKDNYFSRTKNISIKAGDLKNLLQTKFFKGDYHDWFMNKQFTSHGYDNSVSEFYWRQKDLPQTQPITKFPAFIQSNKLMNTHSTLINDEYLNNFTNLLVNNPNSYFSIDKSSKPKSSERIEELSLVPNGFTLKTNGLHPNQILVLTQRFFNGWKAYLESEELPIFKVNNTFMGVEIKNPGNHTITFKYLPVSFLLIYYFYILLILSWIIFFLQKKIRIKSPGQ